MHTPVVVVSSAPPPTTPSSHLGEKDRPPDASAGSEWARLSQKYMSESDIYRSVGVV